ncbi:Beta-glucan synthesis-associated protein, partial [Phytophthora palmivora]
MNSYMGSYLCDPDNTFKKCSQPRNESTPKSGAMSSFNYQMDAISSNWPIHFGAYTGFYDYQVEWVTGKNGYVRWMLHGEPLFEVTTESIVNVPQNDKKSNPKKIMIEEPLYVIFNVALSSSWGTTPPNPGQECRGDGKDSVTNAICDSFPMYMKIDYIRLYQDLGDDLEADNYMSVGCDPATHPTKEWIEGHIDEYEDDDNKWEEVAGKAFCKTSDDCTIGGSLGRTALKTGKCVKNRCQCMYHSWGGPRCTSAISGSSNDETGLMSRTYGPPMEAAIALAVVACLLSALSVFTAVKKSARQTKIAMASMDAQRKAAAAAETAPPSENSGPSFTLVTASNNSTYPTKSGIRTWVDPDTPKDKYVYTSSRGRRWDLVMSDEFNVANRSFRPGDDHIWTSLEKPDGVNGALELYSHNMTSTKCDDDGTCYFFIKTVDEVNVIHVYNMYTHPPSFQDVNFWYRGAMVQSWNKFCYQGGMLEVRTQLPGVTDKKSGNPDISLGENGKVKNTKFYPTWPGIWMLGNLGRAIFSASTNRMWPYSYNECDADVFDPSFQRISACDSNPGYGLNPNQGRGAPEIDVLEGGGLAISSSLQIAPGMPDDYRLFPVDTSTGDFSYCLYQYNCNTPGSNYIDVPTSYYQKERGHKSWYQGLRYGANNFCEQNAEEKQDYETVAASVKAGITENTCAVDTCPASGDVNANLTAMDGGTNHWGINSNGTCYPLMNSYMG